MINATPYVDGVSGQQATYKNAYIELIYTFYQIVGWGLRQMIGYFEDSWRNQKLDIPVPSFGHLSDLFAALPVETQQFCGKVAKRIKNGEAISVIIDSTGMRFGKASDWYEHKYGKPCKRRPWRKLHLSMDGDMNIQAIAVTDCDISDPAKIADLISQDIQIDKIIADGAYYSK